MHKEALTINHFQTLREKFAGLQTQLSEYSFPNAFLFRQVHQYELLQGQDTYLIGKTREGIEYVMVTSAPEQLDWSELEHIASEGRIVFPVPEAWLIHFPETRWERSSLPRDTDYICSSDRLHFYAGRHLDGKRNHVRQFFDKHTLVEKTLGETTQQAALQVLDEWHATHQNNDYASCKEAIELGARIGLEGKVYYVEEQPVGLVIGEGLNPDVYAYHFVKGNIKYKGIYPVMYQAYVMQLPEQYKHINLEQDLGMENIRKAKEEYFPEILATKWRLKLKRQF